MFGEYRNVDGEREALWKAVRERVLAGEVTTLRGLVDRLHRLGGAPPPRLTLPIGLIRAGLLFADPLYKARGRKPPFNSEQLNSLERHWAFDDTRARTELGLRVRGLEEGLPPTVEFLKRT